uniref:Uncharacterized protein n=1 Tax=Oryza nivara TaxID=4536 RepID=A0A0E0J3W7_ORYNI
MAAGDHSFAGVRLRRLLGFLFANSWPRRDFIYKAGGAGGDKGDDGTVEGAVKLISGNDEAGSPPYPCFGQRGSRRPVASATIEGPAVSASLLLLPYPRSGRREETGGGDFIYKIVKDARKHVNGSDYHDSSVVEVT